MSARLKNNLIKYGVTIAVSLLASISYIAGKGYSLANEKEKLRILSDGFGLPGIFLICFGLLFVASNEGVFNGIVWGLKYAANTLIPFGRLKKVQKYSDFVEEKKKEKITGFWFLAVVGAADIAVSIIFMILFNAK